MNWGGPGFVVLLVAICTAGWIVNNWIRARHGYPLENEFGGMSDRLADRNDSAADRKIDLLTNENEQLTGKIARLEERISVLERIATDRESSANRLSNQIESLRD